MLFIASRQEAGQSLARKLIDYQGSDAVIYALPRGGVVLGYEIAKELHLPLDIVIARKIGHPDNPEYAVCAITEEGDVSCNELERSLLDPNWLKRQAEKERQEAMRRKTVYLGGRNHVSAQGKTAIVVDDGIATGLTIFAAIRSLQKEKPSKIIVAVPVAPHDVLAELKRKVDEVITLEDADHYLGAVGAHYRDFPQVSDNEVIALLDKTKVERDVK